MSIVLKNDINLYKKCISKIYINLYVYMYFSFCFFFLSEIMKNGIVCYLKNKAEKFMGL